MIEQPVSDKKCTCCGETKPVTQFHSEGWRSGKQQFCSRCKVCKNEADRIKREAEGYKRAFTASDIVIAELHTLATGWYRAEPGTLRWAA